jgi:methyltransferase of ATP-grasp peptide maturase system
MSARNLAGSDSEHARQLRHALADELVRAGHLKSAAWRRAFERVPRHVFVPRFFIDREHDGRYESMDGGNPAQHAEWLAAVYLDDTLVTQLDGKNGTPDPGSRPTSSSTTPGLMALMLEALDIDGGMNVLEVGTGTGYNAALLCERLGADRVTSIDVDPGLVEDSRRRLLSLGYAPTLSTRDGIAGYPANAPYDRIIATVGMPAVPPSWIEQTRPGGEILVNLYRDLGGGALARLSILGDRAEGNFLPGYGGFMPARSVSPPDTLALLTASQGRRGDSRPAAVSGLALDDPSFSFVAALRLSAARIGVRSEAGPDKFWLLGHDGSWACQTADTAGQIIAVQGGRRRLWDELEAIHAEWISLGRPTRSDFGLTVTMDGRHLLWHRRPEAASWDLAPQDAEDGGSTA